MTNSMLLENALIKKSRPRFGSKRYILLDSGSGCATNVRCEVCGKLLFNPQSILIHQGNGCQAKINKS